MERVRRPLPLPRLQDPGRRPERYAVHDRDGRPLAMLGFSTAARKLAPRDRFIGWTPQLREKNLPLVIDNPRFLILPWITIPNLGSHILSGPPATARRLDRALQHHARAHRDLRRDPALHRHLVQGVRLDSRREPPRDGADTTDTPDGINRRRTSGSDPCGRTGGALSTGEIMVLRQPLAPLHHAVTEQKPVTTGVGRNLRQRCAWMRWSYNESADATLTN